MRRAYTDPGVFRDENGALPVSLPFTEDLSPLKAPLTVGAATIPNRLVCQPMEGCDGTADGRPDELTLRRYDRFAKGGAGLIWVEASAVLPEGRANPRQLYLCEKTLDAFKALADRIREVGLKENGAAPVLILQLTHSGRYSKPNGVPEPLIAYNNPIFEKDAPIDPSRIVSDDYLDRVGEMLVQGARLAEQAGYDGADIKCCHRYLNCELLSAFNRPGRYGGSFENRTRLLLESVSGAREVCGADFLITTRLNVYDGFPYPYGFGVSPEGGTDFDPTEGTRLLRELSARGVKLVNITMGNPYFNPHVNRPFAAGAYEPPEEPLTGVARMLLGTAELKRRVPELAIITSAASYLGTAAPGVLAALIREGGADLAGFGRQCLAYPDFARDILQGGMDPKKICLCCSKCTEIMRKPGGTPGCVIRDREVYLPIYQKLCGGK